MDTVIQQKIDSGSGVINLPSGEYKGPFYINHPCIVEGKNTTLWNSKETVLVINSSGVILKNLRLEMINPVSGEFTLFSKNPVTIENVEICGTVYGFGKEDSVPELEKQIRLEKFKSESNNSFYVDFYSPSAAELNTDLKDISFEPGILKEGINKVKINISPLPSKTLLYGDIVLKSVFNRRFYISGIADENAETQTDKYIHKIDENIITNENQNDSSHTDDKLQVMHSVRNEQLVHSTHENREQVCNHVLTRGERLCLDNYTSSPLKIRMGYKALYKQMDIDPYAFMLDSNGITSCDDDFVFFGNRDTNSHALFFNEDKSIDVDLTKVPEHIMRVSFVYSIYNPEFNDNFSKVIDPYITISQNNIEIVRYTAEELFAETTIIFLDIYKHNGKWKLNTIGQGYKEGLKRLCANYGLIVS